MDEDKTYEDIINKDILELMGASGLAEDKKKELYEKMLETIKNRATARILDQLDEKDAEEFKRLADSSDDQKINQFLQSKNIDVPQIMLTEAIIYKTELTDLAKKGQQE